MRWEDWQLDTGIEAIDDDHKVLFDTLNLLMVAGKTGTTEEVGEALELLKLYTKVHFTREESYLARRGGPMVERNAIEHREFEAQLAALANYFAARGADEQFMETVQRLLGDWLVNHILQVDKALMAPKPPGKDKA